MGQLITWATPDYPKCDALPSQGANLIYASDIRRHTKFTSTYSIKFPLQGSLTYIADRQKIEVKPGSLYLVNWGKELECLPCAPGVEAVCVNFSPALIADIAENGNRHHRALLDDPAAGNPAIRFFEHIYKTPHSIDLPCRTLAAEMKRIGRSAAGFPPDIFFFIAERLLHWQAGARIRIESIPAAALSTRQELFRRVLAARDFMVDQWDYNLTHEEVARHACLSPYHFHRTFKEVFGVSPMRWFRRLKLEKARELLKKGQCNVTTAAYRCGFSDVFTFSKAFKKTWGLCPSEC